MIPNDKRRKESLEVVESRAILYISIAVFILVVLQLVLRFICTHNREILKLKAQ